jgi:hypothetical protein
MGKRLVSAQKAQLCWLGVEGGAGPEADSTFRDVTEVAGSMLCLARSLEWSERRIAGSKLRGLWLFSKGNLNLGAIHSRGRDGKHFRIHLNSSNSCLIDVSLAEENAIENYRFAKTGLMF